MGLTSLAEVHSTQQGDARQHTGLEDISVRRLSLPTVDAAGAWQGTQKPVPHLGRVLPSWACHGIENHGMSAQMPGLHALQVGS